MIMPNTTRSRTETTPRVNPATWVEKHGAYLHRYAMYRLGNETAAKDVVQETFLAAMKAKDRFSGKSSERTWLTGILKHKVVDQFRANGREQAYEDQHLAHELQRAEHAYLDRKGRWKVVPTQSHTHPAQALERAEFCEMFAGCLSQLQGRLQTVFTLREMEGQSSEQICRTLNITASNLWVTLHRARKRLRSCMEAKRTGSAGTCCEHG